jgi:signal transduction histidine kinase
MTERFAVIIYSFYTANLCLDIVRENWEVWIPVVMFAPVVAGWILFFSSYGDYRIRAAFSAMLMQFTMILYAMYMDDPVREIPVLMATCILVAFYGFPRLLWMTLVALLFIIFYHGVISDTFRILSRENLLNFLFQTGNLVWPGMALFFWMRRQKESYAEMGRMIRVLEETKQSKDDFLSNISHEIRTPVNTICGMSELAMYQENADRRREEISDIRDAGRSLMSLINDILDFTQLQQGRMDLEEEAYSITSTISDIVAMAMARKKGRRIGLIVDCDADIPCRLLGDEKKIRRVIMNLVDNAVKFTSCVLS